MALNSQAELLRKLESNAELRERIRAYAATEPDSIDSRTTWASMRDVCFISGDMTRHEAEDAAFRAKMPLHPKRDEQRRNRLLRTVQTIKAG